MDTSLPGIVVTGASGFIGRHALAALAGRYRLFCLARRSRREAGIPEYENMRWTQVDIGRWDTMRQVVSCIKDHGGADYVLHLAGYYDFHNMDNPEYDRTNVLGTRNVLKLARQIGVKRFLFASSLAACPFPENGETITESSPPTADFAYARSKRAGEELVQQHSEWFPTSTLRLAAVYSDWCEYPPLYVFLKTWLGGEWNARILGGRGESAVTYIHIHDLMRLVNRILERSDDLPREAIYNVSPSHVATHDDLYRAATRYFYGEEVEPTRIPKWLAGPGVQMRWWLGKLTGRLPFEAPWMIRYIDRQLRVDATETEKALDWSVTPRLDVSRRLLMMIENMKSHGEAWSMRNEAALRRVARRPNLVLHEVLEDMRDEIVDLIEDYMIEPDHRARFSRYLEMDHETRRWFVSLFYQVLATSVRTRERHLVQHYAQVIAVRRHNEGFGLEQVRDVLTTHGEIISGALHTRPELADMKQVIYDHITLSIQLAVDGVEDAYDTLDSQSEDAVNRLGGTALPTTAGELEHMVQQLENICEDALPRPLRAGP